MTEYLKGTWANLTSDLNPKKHEFLQEMEQLYNGKDRYYHTLTHITALHRLTDIYGQELKEPDTVRWAIWYHDAVYDVTRRDNEAKSAALAGERMSTLGVKQDTIETCCSMIQATESHSVLTGSNNYDYQFLPDIDLLILGATPEKYEEYCQQIRQEYGIYNDETYKAGRLKVLEHFLERKVIFKTSKLHELYEEQARKNINTELKWLQ